MISVPRTPNKIYEEGFYNEYQKRRYLKTLPEKSVEHSTRILNRVREIEEIYDIDLYNFNLDQVELLLSRLEPSTLTASRSNYYLVYNYIQWGIEQDLREGNKLNPLETLNDVKYLKKFIDDTKKTLFTKDEIDDIISICTNAQDSCVVSLLFNGVFGTSGYDELLNLNKKSFYPNNGLLLRDGDEERFIKVSPECYELAEKALHSQIYYKNNGDLKETMKSSGEAKLVNTDYVLKNVFTNMKSIDKGEKHLVLRRIAAVKEYADLKVFTPYMIRYSGMLWMAKQLYEKHGELSKKQYEDICDQFGVKIVMNNNVKVYNYTRFKEDFLNVETIKRIYNMVE